MTDEILQEKSAQPAPDSTASGSKPEVTFQGNSHDLTALSAMGLGLLMLGMCLSCNFFYYFLPLGAMALGIIGLVFSRMSVNPQRSRIFSYIGLGSGLLIFLLIIVIVILYFGAIILMAVMGNR